MYTAFINYCVGMNNRRARNLVMIWPEGLGPYFFKFVKHTSNEDESTFGNLGIAPKLIEIISSLGYTIPTPIQRKAIPMAIEGKDILGVAQTGTGKTLAFAIPLLQRISVSKGRGLVMVPTRELALQVSDSFAKIGKSIGLKSVVLIGGAPIEPQIRALKTNPHVIIGTPGRIIDHMVRKSLNLDSIHVLVLDEADLMLDMGFAPQINRVLEQVPAERQTMLFSATMPSAIGKLANTYMNSPIRVEVARSGSTPDKISQEVQYMDKGGKTRALDAILKLHEGSAITFVRTKFSAKRLCFELKGHGYSAAEIHSNRSLAQRRAALDGFKSGKNRVLVATDIAARGIDVSGVALVVNYDLPENPEDYVHRIGRTGRAGLKGRAISLATKGERSLVYRIEKLINGTLASSNASFAKEEMGAYQIRDVVAPRRTPYGQSGQKKTDYSENYGYRKNRTQSSSPTRFGGAKKKSPQGGYARRKSW